MMGWICALTMVGSALEGASGSELPRYELEPGMRLTYTGILVSESFELKFDSGRNSRGEDFMIIERSPRLKSTAREIRVVFTALSTNEDGSVKVLAMTTVKAIPRIASLEEFQVVYEFDLHEDGRIKGNSLNGGFDLLDDLFPMLPTSETELAEGWSRTTWDSWATSVHRTVAHQPSRLAFKRSIEGPRKDVFEATVDESFEFDATRGVIRSAKRELEQKRGYPLREWQYLTLDSVEELGGRELESLTADGERYVTIWKRSRQLWDDLESAPTHEAAAEGLKSILANKEKFEDSTISKVAERHLEFIESILHRDSTEGKRRREAIGQPIPAWRLKDVEGKEHSLEQYRGKVVLMSFWQDDSEHDARFLVQLKEIEEELRDQPVSVLGVDDFDNVQAARFVADRLELPFPVLTNGNDFKKEFDAHLTTAQLVIDTEGRLVSVWTGSNQERKKALLDSIRKALGKGPASN